MIERLFIKGEEGVFLFTPSETFEKGSILSKVKEDENFNRRNTFSISRIKFESDAEIGQKGAFFKGLVPLFQ